MLQKKKSKLNKYLKKKKKKVGVISKKSCFTTKKIFNEAVNVN